MEAIATPLMPQPVVKTGGYRLNAIDLLRGLVMIVMALDHARDLLHIHAFTGDPLDLNATSTELFFTRWITHYCAPVFVFLSGTSVFLQSLRKSKKELSGFLIKRGFWLILVEITIVTFGISFDTGYSIIVLQVIWAIGISMVLLGVLIWLPFRLLAALGFIIVCGHNSLDFWERSNPANYSYSVFYSLLHRQAFPPLGNGHTLLILYPFLAWTGVMILGYCFGKLYTRYEDPKDRSRISLQTGLVLIVLFLVIRGINVYGDPSHWAEQKNGWFTVLSFINTTKYPPSLLYLCMTIGPALVFLSFAEKMIGTLARFIIVYGRVPFFYYILHFYMLHAISAGLYLYRGHSYAEGAKGIPGFPFKFVMPGEGYSLAIVYLIWICVVLALYPLCKWFSNYKQTHRQWWLSYV